MLALETGRPWIRVLSLGAGVQSTTLALMACHGQLPRLDLAIFADTGGEPRRVYDHLAQLTDYCAGYGLPVIKVSKGNLARDAVDPDHRYASVPYFVQNAPGPCEKCGTTGRVTDEAGERRCPRCKGSGWDNGQGMGRRQCTSEYKIEPIYRKVRELLGARPPRHLRVPKGRHAELWVGFSTDEIGRVNDAAPGYVRVRHPLLELDLDRKACLRFLHSQGWTSVAKSACVFCPYHGNRQWRNMRDNHPDEWRAAVEFDAAIRKGGSHGLPLDGEAFLHRERVPLGEANIDRYTRREWRERQGDLLDLIADTEAGLGPEALLAEEGSPDGCGPFACRSSGADDGDAA